MSWSSVSVGVRRRCRPDGPCGASLRRSVTLGGARASVAQGWLVAGPWPCQNGTAPRDDGGRQKERRESLMFPQCRERKDQRISAGRRNPGASNRREDFQRMLCAPSILAGTLRVPWGSRGRLKAGRFGYGSLAGCQCHRAGRLKAGRFGYGSLAGCQCHRADVSGRAR